MDTTHITKISDFSDKINPMLVKELRQGMRGIGFVSMFVSFQLLLCFILVMTASTARVETAGDKLSGIIIFFFFIASIIFQPFRGLSALHQEIKGNTIDLLCMTRLDAWRITFGKWLSIVAQTALLLTAVTPYLILRYFFGDMQLFSEVLLLFTLFIFSCTLTAVAIALSAVQATIIRIIFPIFGIFMLLMTIPSMIFGGGGITGELLKFTTLYNLESVLTYLGVLSLCAYIIWFCLDFGTSIIAPASENHATKRRLITLGYLILLLATCLIADFEPMTTAIFASLFAVPVIITSLTEPSEILPVTAMPFTTKGPLHRISRYALYPGWTSGLIYTLIIYLLVQVAVTNTGYIDNKALTAANIIFSIMLFPLAFTTLFFRKTTKRLGCYITALIAQFIILISLSAIAETTRQDDIFSFFFWIPSCMIYISADGLMDNDSILALSYANVAIYSFIPLVLSIPAWRVTKETEQHVIHKPS